VSTRVLTRGGSGSHLLRPIPTCSEERLMSFHMHSIEAVIAETGDDDSAAQTLTAR
jgi:hypothetical protein